MFKKLLLICIIFFTQILTPELNDEEQTMSFSYPRKHIFRKQPVKVDGVDGRHGRVAKSSWLPWLLPSRVILEAEDVSPVASVPLGRPLPPEFQEFSLTLLSLLAEPTWQGKMSLSTRSFATFLGKGLQPPPDKAIFQVMKTRPIEAPNDQDKKRIRVLLNDGINTFSAVRTSH